MESATYKIETYLGEFIVEETGPNLIVINIGNNVRIQAHLKIPHTVKPGEYLPLYTRIPYAIAQPTQQ